MKKINPFSGIQKKKANLVLCGNQGYILFVIGFPNMEKLFQFSEQDKIIEYCNTNDIEIVNKDTWTFLK